MENKKELKKPEEKAEEAVGGEKKLNDGELEQVAGGRVMVKSEHVNALCPD